MTRFLDMMNLAPILYPTLFMVDKIIDIKSNDSFEPKYITTTSSDKSRYLSHFKIYSVFYFKFSISNIIGSLGQIIYLSHFKNHWEY